ncbi:MAG: radical SAM protein [Bradyrhizobium sp.]|nr:radical SAM protein [Bradyrhizobium sp.]
MDLSRIHFPVTTLGPGRRIGIWFQGCSLRCSGCISMDTWAPGRGTTTVDEVIRSISVWSAIADGVTISGGEPFDQPEALFELTARIRDVMETNILVFTGYEWDAVSDRIACSPGLIDALVSGPFVREEKQTLVLRGSDNQALHLLTPLGETRFASLDRRLNATDRTLDVMFDENGDVWFAGIPSRDDFGRLRHVLESAGATLSTSEDKRIASPTIHVE